MKIINTFLVLLLVSASILASDIHIRFNEKKIIGNKLHLDVQVRSASTDFTLATQNLRFYYNSDALSLDFSSTVSPLSATQKYASAELVKKLENANATGVSQLDFDDNLGFANIGLRLIDDRFGGVTINKDWTTVATVVFTILDTENMEVVWARNDKTDLYHTAFVEVGEWKSPKQIERTTIIDFEDYVYQKELTDLTAHKFEVSVSPNPTTDYIHVNIGKQDAPSKVQLLSVDGSIVREWTQQNDTATYSVGDVVAGQYLLLVDSPQGDKDVKRLHVVR